MEYHVFASRLSGKLRSVLLTPSSPTTTTAEGAATGRRRHKCYVSVRASVPRQLIRRVAGGACCSLRSAEGHIRRCGGRGGTKGVVRAKGRRPPSCPPHLGCLASPPATNGRIIIMFKIQPLPSPPAAAHHCGASWTTSVVH